MDSNNNLFISIGGACDVKYNIAKHIGNMHTLFFDWLMVDTDSVSNVIGTKDIDELLKFDNIIQNKKNPVNQGHATIDIKSLTFCQSIHDVPEKFIDQHIKIFIDRYKRRYHRIIKYIKKNKHTIYFIRKGSISEEEKNKFINTIKDINPKCNFKLVSLKNEKVETDSKYFVPVNLDDYQISPIDKNNWTSSYYDWKKIFDDVRK